MDLYFKKLIFNGSYFKSYSEKRPVVFYKANILYLRKSILKRKEKDTKETWFDSKLSFPAASQVSGFIQSMGKHHPLCPEQSPRSDKAGKEKDLKKVRNSNVFKPQEESFSKHCIHTWNWIMQLNCTWINCFLKRFWSLLIVALQDRQPYKLLFPTYPCVVCQLYLIGNHLEEYKTVGGGK